MRYYNNLAENINEKDISTTVDARKNSNENTVGSIKTQQVEKLHTTHGWEPVLVTTLGLDHGTPPELRSYTRSC